MARTLPPSLPHPALTRPGAVFFDLDGTLADTAADLAAPVNAMRGERGLEPLPLDALRPYASAGARGLLGKGLGITPAAAEYNALRLDFLSRYERDIMRHTRLFPRMAELLDRLDDEGIRWGVISNKVERYVRIIVDQLGLASRSAVIFGGDSAARPKPHPDLMLLALQKTGLTGERCIYVGDDRRDIVAGQAAGMATVAAAYGYCGTEDPPTAWGADAVITSPDELLASLKPARAG